MIAKPARLHFARTARIAHPVRISGRAHICASYWFDKTYDYQKALDGQHTLRPCDGPLFLARGPGKKGVIT